MILTHTRPAINRRAITIGHSIASYPQAHLSYASHLLVGTAGSEGQGHERGRL